MLDDHNCCIHTRAGFGRSVARGSTGSPDTWNTPIRSASVGQIDPSDRILLFQTGLAIPSPSRTSPSLFPSIYLDFKPFYGFGQIYLTDLRMHVSNCASVCERRSITSHDANLIPPSSAAVCLPLYYKTTLGISVRTNSLGYLCTRFLNHREAV